MGKSVHLSEKNLHGIEKTYHRSEKKPQGMGRQLHLDGEKLHHPGINPGSPVKETRRS